MKAFPKPDHPAAAAPAPRPKRKPRYRAPKAWRRVVSVPAILAPAVAVRIEEQERDTFSHHIIEGVCFDMRLRRDHAVTSQFAADPPEIQDAIDRFIVAHYRPSMERDGGTLRALILDTLPPMEPLTVRPAPMVARSRPVFFPPLLAEKIKERWGELGFTSLSQYVTSLIRYDLLIGGKHLYFRGDDCTQEMLASLNRETLNEYLANRKPKIKADYLLEQVAGRELTREECEGLLRAIGRKLPALAIKYFL